jgi:Zn-dependent metalloprotease
MTSNFNFVPTLEKRGENNMKAIKILKSRIIIRTRVLIIIILLIVSVGGFPVSAQKNSHQADPDLSMLAAQCSNAQSEMTYERVNGRLQFIGTAAGMPIKQPMNIQKIASPEEAARGYLSVCGPLFGVSNQTTELQIKRQNTTEDGRSVVHFRQSYQGIPIFGAELVIQLNATNDIIMVNGDILPGIQLDIMPTINMISARKTALQLVAEKYGLESGSLTASEPELSIYDPGLIQEAGGETLLVWQMEVTPVELKPIRELVLVDAQLGTVVLSLNQIDATRNRETYTAGNSTIQPGTLVCDESNPTCTGGDTDAVNAHVYAGDTYDFYLSYHGRDSLDNAGMALISTVHYDNGYCNAFWNGVQMTYGDGCFIVVDDIVAHEMTHGVTEHESNLIYSNESGAINESFSDIWGEFVDFTNGKGNDISAVRWYIGEDSSSGSMRYMKDPTIYGDPDRIGSPNFYHGSNDNGGVHTNSGVSNKAAYLITDGDTFNGYTVTGIGITKTAKIYYEAQTNILTPTSKYTDLYDALYQACNNLIGTSGIISNDCTQVRNATLATEMNYVPPPAVCESNQLCIQVLNKQGYPVTDGSLQVYKDLYTVYAYGSTDNYGWSIIDVEAGTYQLIVTSDQDDFMVLKDVTAPGKITVDPGGTVQVNVNARRLDGSPLQSATIYATPSSNSWGRLGSTDNNGSLTTWVTPGTYSFMAWSGIKDINTYYIAKTSVPVVGTTNVDLHAALMPTGQMPMTHVGFELGYVAIWSDASRNVSPNFIVNNGDVLILSAMNYSIWGGMAKDFNGIRWFYYLEGKPFNIEEGGYYPFVYGGDFTITTVPEQDSYMPGDNVSIINTIMDSYGNQITGSGTYPASAFSVGDNCQARVFRTAGIDQVKPICSPAIDKQIWVEIRPHIIVTDPNGIILSQDQGNNGSIIWTKHGFTLPSDSVLGMYNVHLTLDTGPHNGVISANDTFLVEPVTKLLSISKSGTGNGTVTSSPAGINCGLTCNYNFAPNTVVILTATPISPSTFAGWSGGGCSGTGTCNLTMSEANNVTADFTLGPYMVFLPLIIR